LRLVRVGPAADNFARVKRWIVAGALLVACGARTDLGKRSIADAAVDAPADVPVPACASGALAATGTKPDTIAIDGAFVYWHDETGVSRVPKTGGQPEVVASSPATFWPELAAFALADGYVFFASAAGTASRVAASGGTADILGWNQPELAFAASSKFVYAWSPQGGPTPIMRFGFDGSGPNQVDDLTHPPNEMIVDANETAYVTSDPGVLANDYAGKSGLDVLLSGLTATDVAPAGEDVYFTSDDATNGARVMVVSTKTLNAHPIGDTKGAFALAQDDSDLYFTDGLGLRVRRIAGKKGPVTDVASVGPNFSPIDLVVDGACVYFTSAPRDGGSAGAVTVAPK